VILVHSAIHSDAHAPKGVQDLHKPFGAKGSTKIPAHFAMSSNFSWHTVLYVKLALDKCYHVTLL